MLKSMCLLLLLFMLSVCCEFSDIPDTDVEANEENRIVLDVEMRNRLTDAFCLYRMRYCLEFPDIDEEHCQCSSIEPEMYENIDEWPSSNLNISLLCHEANKIVLNTRSVLWAVDEEVTMFVEQRTTNANSWKYINSTNSSIIVVDKLTPNTDYTFRVWCISRGSANGVGLHMPVESGWWRTPELHTSPLPVGDLELLRYEYHENDHDYMAVIRWTPSLDKSCNHEFVWFGGDDVSDYTQLEIEIPFNYTITIDKLAFNRNYSMAVMTKSSDWSAESEKRWYYFQTPHCLDVLGTLEFCVPLSPLALNVQEVLFPQDDGVELVYNLNVSWNQPGAQPDYYLLHLNTFAEVGDNGQYSLRIDGNATAARFENIRLRRLHYQVTLFAYSAAGRSDAAEFYKQLNAKDLAGVTLLTNRTEVGDGGDGHSKTVVVFVLPLLVVVVCMALTLTYGYRELNKRKQIMKRQRYFEELEMKSHYLETPLPGIDGGASLLAGEDDGQRDEWEIDAKYLCLQGVLGRGAFGIVRKGWLLKGDTRTPVAVKMLLDDHRHSDVKDFKQEMDIMKSVGSHPHIVSLIGCCTRDLNVGGGAGRPADLRLIVEYCARGDLLTYLRSVWDRITNQCNNDTDEEQHQYMNIAADDQQMNIDNKLYLLGVGGDGDVQGVGGIMQIKDLVSIGLQVAMGMEHLSSLHVIHRDLAARNVLVCEDGSVKVSDFGLSRDVYRDNIYCKTSTGKLPIRWLALESLTHQVYTTQSDVWSFGVLLWEIITLGGNPYPGVHTHELLDLLIKGYRMGCPTNCSQEVYSIMSNCWHMNARERPSFTDIRRTLEGILEHTSEYLNLNVYSTGSNCGGGAGESGEKMYDAPKQHNKSSPERYVKAFAL